MDVHTAERAEPLAAHLAGVLATPPSDPFADEWVAVPTERMRRWLHLELARHLGATPGGTDGVLAHVRPAFPGTLRSAVLEAGIARGDDPWQVERLAWALLEVADAHDDPATRALQVPAAGGSRHGRARHVADLFDRYHVHRPDMVLAWARGHDLDGAGHRLASHHRWQPALWRLVHAHVGVPSPPERLGDLLEQAAAGELVLDLPDRLALFGLSVLPAGSGFLDVARAVGAQRELHLYLLEPSSSLGRRLAAGGDPDDLLLRSDDRTLDAVHNPLLASWGRLHRETAVLRSRLPEATSQEQGAAATPPAGPVQGDLFAGPGDEHAPTVLGRLQADVRADRPPDGSFAPGAGDRSLQLHTCFGPTRQVEALRDALLHLLADPDLALSEDDIVVGCADLDTFAPLVELVLGPSADHAVADPRRAPALRYRLARRPGPSSNPSLSALIAVLDVVRGRFEAPAVLDLLSLPPVRRRAHLSDDDLAQLGEWIEDANVRWGLDAEHRRHHGLDTPDAANTWRHALDRLLLGVALADDDPVLGLGEVAPLGAEGDAAGLAGRLAEVLWQLARLAEGAGADQPLEQWAAWLRDAADALLDTSRDERWQLDGVHRLLADLAEAATVGGEQPSATLLRLADVRRLLTEGLAGERDRPVHFRGGITFCDLPLLRWVPSRVVCLLGMDERALTSGGIDGDDLVAAAPRFGDRDPRGESRLALLETVLAAGDHLLVFRDGHDVNTNQEVPEAVPLAELRDAVRATVAAEAWPAYEHELCVAHPRQASDAANFTDDGPGPPGPWSFDPAGLDGAAARARRSHEPAPFLPAPLPPAAQHGELVELDALARFLKHPVKAFFERRLEVRFPQRDDPLSARLPVDLAALARWKVADRLLTTLLDGGTTDDWLRLERQRGSLPPGVLGQQAVEEIVHDVEHIVAAADARGLRRGPASTLPVEATLPDGTRLVGTVEHRLDAPRPGPAMLTYSRSKDDHRLQAWLSLVALVATEPSTPWRSLAVSRNRSTAKSAPPHVAVDLVPTTPEHAVEALATVVDCYRRGMVEPVPLFPTVSPELRRGRRSTKSWHDSYLSLGDGDDDASALAYPVELDELLELPARPDDPDGAEQGRAARFAEHLWSAVERSAEELPEPEEAPT